MLTALVFFLVLSGLVLVHEFGHYLAARLCGIKAHEFGIGLPPRLIGLVKEGKRWKRVGRHDRGIYRNTVWSINWLPFGGFVRLKGEDAGEVHDKDAVMSRPLWQRMFVISAGVLMNWLTAIVLFSIVLGHGVTAVLDDVPKDAHIADRRIAVTDTLPGSPAAQAGLRSGDVLLLVNGHGAPTASGLRDLIREQAAAGQVFISYRQDGQEKGVLITPVELSETKALGIGVGLADLGLVSFGPVAAVRQGVIMTARMTVDVFVALGAMVKDLVVRHRMSQDVSGPVGIAIMTGQAARDGWATLLQFAATLSVNLAVINVLPIPALDGGRLFFMLLEKVRRRPVDRKLEIGIHNIAYVALIGLILLVTFSDLGRYGGQILGGLKGLVGM